MTTALLLPSTAHARPHNLTTWARYEHFHLRHDLVSRSYFVGPHAEADLLKVLPEVHVSIWHDWRVFDDKYDALEQQAFLSSGVSKGSGCSFAYVSEHESHGNYDAVNASTGAYGRWQIIPSTAASYGCDLSTHAGQDECARRVLAGQGWGAWSVCG